MILLTKVNLTLLNFQLKIYRIGLKQVCKTDLVSFKDQLFKIIKIKAIENSVIHSANFSL